MNVGLYERAYRMVLLSVHYGVDAVATVVEEVAWLRLKLVPAGECLVWVVCGPCSSIFILCALQSGLICPWLSASCPATVSTQCDYLQSVVVWNSSCRV